MVTHENINIPSPIVLVCPDHRMISHLNAGVWRIRRLIDSCQDLNVRTWRFVPCVPLLLIHYKGRWHILHHRMRRTFHDNGRVGELRNVVSESDSAHELGKPGPYPVSVEFSKQGGVMESNPPASAFCDVFCECGYRRRCPAVGGVVQLDEYLVLSQECIVYLVSILYVVDLKIVLNGQLLQPYFGSIDKRPVDAAGFRQSNDPEFRLGALGHARAGENEREDHYAP
jgi:hypothetical protein